MPTEFVIVVHGAEMPDGMVEVPESGHYLRPFDPALHDGLKPFPVTLHRDQAVKFRTADAALAFWHTQSVLFPLRDDGLPNRPLTALTCEVVPIEVEAEGGPVEFVCVDCQENVISWCQPRPEEPRCLTCQWIADIPDPAEREQMRAFLGGRQRR